MKNIKVILIAYVLFLGILYIGLAIPLANGKVAPNGTYGFRTEKTLSNEDVWYKTNTYFGDMFFKAGLSVVIISLISFFFRKKMPLWTHVILSILVPVIPVFIAVVKTVLFLNEL